MIDESAPTIKWTYEAIKFISKAELELLTLQELRDLHTSINQIWNYHLYPTYVEATKVIESKSRPLRVANNSNVLDMSMLQNLTPEAKAMLANILMSTKK